MQTIRHFKKNNQISWTQICHILIIRTSTHSNFQSGQYSGAWVMHIIRSPFPSKTFPFHLGKHADLAATLEVLLDGVVVPDPPNPNWNVGLKDGYLGATASTHEIQGAKVDGATINVKGSCKTWGEKALLVFIHIMTNCKSSHGVVQPTHCKNHRPLVAKHQANGWNPTGSNLQSEPTNHDWLITSSWFLQWVLLFWWIFMDYLIQFTGSQPGIPSPTSRPRHPQGPLASLCLKLVHAEERLFRKKSFNVILCEYTDMVHSKK